MASKVVIFSVFSAMPSCTILLLPQLAYAQLIQVRPGYVKAPFVRVINYADGSSYVRAPFVSVRNRPRNYSVPALIVQERVASSHSANLNVTGSPSVGREGQKVRRLALEELRILRRTLAPEWQEYLHLDSLVQLLGTSDDEFLRTDQRERLKEMLGDYEATINTENVVGNTGSVRKLHDLLLRLVLPPEQRRLDELAEAKRKLDVELAHIRATEIWGPYLRLPKTSVIQRQGIPSPPGDGEDEAAELERALARYNLAAEDPQYELITKLPAFQMTRNKLASYLESLRHQNNTSTPEQLPLPDAQLDELSE